MAIPIIMPRQGQSVESCIISKWNKKAGDKVSEGEILFTYETDKATFEEEAKVSGTMIAVFFNEGDDVPVLTNVCVIGNPGESCEEFKPGNSDDKAPSEPQETGKEETKAEESSAQTLTQPASDDNIKISPRARHLAEKTGADYRFAAPTGPEGRIIERDIVALQQNGPIVTSAAKEEYMKLNNGITTGTGLGGRITTADLKQTAAPVASTTETAVQAEYTEVKLTNIRKVIAKAMHHSITSTCQLTLNASFDASAILAYRSKLKQAREKMGLQNITINDIILYAVSRTLTNHKDLNSHFLDDKMIVFNNIHLGVAVDTDRGLMVPTIMNANLKTLDEISKEAKALADSCQKGTISPDLLKGGSFTVSNLGSLDIESFTPVLNPPQTGILGVDNIVQRVRETDGNISVYPAMGLSLTFDHRAVDGAPAARFLKELKSNLENFELLLAK